MLLCTHRYVPEKAKVKNGQKVSIIYVLGESFQKMGIRKTGTQKYQFPGEWLRAYVMILKSVFAFSIFKLKQHTEASIESNQVKDPILDEELRSNISNKQDKYLEKYFL